VDPQFIEESKAADLCKPRQKFAPYTKSQRRKRRAEVARLHFGQGMSAVAIAEAMHVDRNTINTDLKLLYREESKNWDAGSLEDYLYKQLTRLEAQRDRLSSYLSKANNNIEKQLAVERLIADIDFKLLAAMERLNYGATAFWDRVIKEVNKLGEGHDIKFSYTSLFEIWRIARKSRKSMSELLDEANKV
jgi:hypothetical protein